MAVPTVLTQGSAGAPTLNGQDGSLIDVLDWALPQLGWTTPFTNTATKGVYRNDNTLGTGYYLRVIDAAADHGADARRASIQGYSTMSDIDTGTDGYPSTDQYWTKSATADSTSRNYCIIGTGKFFYFFTFFGNGYRWGAAGDFIPLYGTDSGEWIIISDDSTSTSSGDLEIPYQVWHSGNFPPNASALNGLMFSFDGTNTSRDCVLASIGNAGVASATDEPGSVGAYPSAAGDIPTSKIYLFDFDDTAINRFFRGYLPGLLNPLCDIAPSTSIFTPLQNVAGISNGTSTITAQYIPLNPRLATTSTSGEGAFLMDTETDWDNF